MLFTLISPWMVVKIMIVTLFLFYLVFAGVIVRQVVLMNKVVELTTNRPLYLTALTHVILAGIVFLLALLFL